MTSHINRMLGIGFGLFRATRCTPKLLSLIVASMVGLVSAQGIADPSAEDSDQAERTVAYRHYL